MVLIDKGEEIHDSVEDTATTTEGSARFDVANVVFMANDGTADIYLNFDMTTNVSKGKLTLKPGERFFDFPRSCKTLYYRAASGTQAFRVWGVK